MSVVAKSFCLALFCFCIFVFIAPVSASDAVDQTLRESAVNQLKTVLNTEERWVKVHAAEYLLELEYTDGVQSDFEQELNQFATEPQYRIGIWRVLSKTSPLASGQQKWVKLIKDACFGDEDLDRLHAMETLAKLKVQFTEEEMSEANTIAATWPEEDAVFAWWALMESGDSDAEGKLISLLNSENPTTKLRAAYAFQFQSTISPESLNTLLQATRDEPADSPARSYMLAAVLRHVKDSQAIQNLKPQLLEYIEKGKTGEKRQVADYLSVKGEKSDISTLKTLLADENSDVRASAAHALLRIGRRLRSPMHSLDWIVIALYGFGMIGIGYYYMQKTKSSDDYLLGGRNMRSWAVGLSLFATLLSTLTYLAYPGEMIKNGPMILCQLIAIPIIFGIVGWLVIPFIMKLRVTSAYEILEKRFGCSVRLLGVVFFLSLRLLWMAVIVFATTEKVLIPLLGLDPSMTPWLCAVLGIVTLLYTSMGGLRAVVVTDVVQTFILFGAALLTIVMVTFSLGGIGQWWPDAWMSHWEAPRWGFETNGRITLGWAVVSFIIWQVCTNASDQMSIQRFLATRDAKAARGVMLTNLIAVSLVSIMLAIVGLALLAYFQANPHALGDGQRIAANADSLLPQYIAFAMPAGISGLVIAGLLAAAMSSLSSGVNSSSSVITVDFVDRFRTTPLSDLQHVRMAKFISIGVGAIVVGISFLVSMVPGNLLEVCFRAVNLLTVPLAILFFMAMFVSWATPFGAWCAALASTASAVLIAYWEPIFGTQGPSFMWIMPVALVSGMLAGMIFSLVPIGNKASASLSEIMVK